MSGVKVAVVTGSNKGIGLAIVRRLCKDFEGVVYLTARSRENGLAAVAKLEAEGLSPKFHQLDITSTDSISSFAKYLYDTYGGLDLLVNNAGIACMMDVLVDNSGLTYKIDPTASFSEQVKRTIETNFTGTLSVCRALFPLMRAHGRIVNMSSMLGQRSILNKEELKDQFADPALTEEQLVKLMAQFVRDVDGHTQNGWTNAYEASKMGVMILTAYQKKEVINSGKEDVMVDFRWPNASYGVSKIGVTALTKVQAREMAKSGKEDVLVNACCPGWVRTDASCERAPLTPDQGAETPVYLALLPAGSPSGEFWYEKKISDWN